MTSDALSGVHLACELAEKGSHMVEARFRREHPGPPDQQVAEHVRQWWLDRPGAPDGDAAELSVARFGHLMAMKLLAGDDRRRRADADDLRALAGVAQDDDWRLTSRGASMPSNHALVVLGVLSDTSGRSSWRSRRQAR